MKVPKRARRIVALTAAALLALAALFLVTSQATADDVSPSHTENEWG